MADLRTLQANVFPGESGGDYDALFGFSNRPGGAFAGVRPSQMTINEVLALTDPRGPYAQWVKSQIGRVATPVGGYQVVGSTLRDAVRRMGLRGDERFDKDMQDRIGMEIYRTQGPGAWEGWGKGGNGGRVTMSSKGGPAMGLLDMQDEPQTFGDRLREGWRSGSLMDNLALAFNSMRMNPDQNLAQIVQNRQEQRAGERATNRTAQWLMSQGREDLAQALLSGAVDAKTAAAVALTPAKDDRTAMIQNYEYWLAQGKSPDEAQALARAGSGGTVIDMSGGGKFEEGFAKGDAELLGTVYASGLQAQRNLGRIDQLERLLASAPTGMQGALTLAAGQFGINTEGLSEAQAAQALINSLVPEQRAPGSGPMSDADLELFKQSLPRIINQPGGNALIIDTMRKIAQYDAQGAAIVQKMREGQIDRATAFRELAERPNPLANIIVPQGTATPGQTTPDGLTSEDLEFLR